MKMIKSKVSLAVLAALSTCALSHSALGLVFFELLMVSHILLSSVIIIEFKFSELEKIKTNNNFITYYLSID